MYDYIGFAKDIALIGCLVYLYIKQVKLKRAIIKLTKANENIYKMTKINGSLIRRKCD